MEPRKLIRLGNSSFALALPKNWIEKSGLKKGDNIFLEENSRGEIIIRPNPEEKKDDKSIIINAGNKDVDALKRELRTAYVRGYTSMNIKGVKKETKDSIKSILDDLMSFELLEVNDKEVNAKDFFSMGDANLVNSIRRIDNNIREIFDITQSELKKEKINLKKIKEIEVIDKDINKFYFLCSRVFLRGVDNPAILTSLKTNGIKLFNEWWFSFNLEALADSAKNFIKSLQKTDNSKTEIIAVYSEIYDAYLKCMEAFYKEDIEIANKIMKTTGEIRERLLKLEKEDTQNSQVFNELAKLNRQIYQNTKMILYLKY